MLDSIFPICLLSKCVRCTRFCFWTLFLPAPYSPAQRSHLLATKFYCQKTHLPTYLCLQSYRSNYLLEMAWPGHSRKIEAQRSSASSPPFNWSSLQISLFLWTGTSGCDASYLPHSRHRHSRIALPTMLVRLLKAFQLLDVDRIKSTILNQGFKATPGPTQVPFPIVVPTASLLKPPQEDILSVLSSLPTLMASQPLKQTGNPSFCQASSCPSSFFIWHIPTPTPWQKSHLALNLFSSIRGQKWCFRYTH